MKIVEENSQEVRERIQHLSEAGGASESQVTARELLKDLGLTNMLSELKPETPLHQDTSPGTEQQAAGEEAGEEVESAGEKSDDEAYRQTAAAAALCLTRSTLEQTRAEVRLKLANLNLEAW